MPVLMQVGVFSATATYVVWATIIEQACGNNAPPIGWRTNRRVI